MFLVHQKSNAMTVTFFLLSSPPQVFFVVIRVQFIDSVSSWSKVSRSIFLQRFFQWSERLLTIVGSDFWTCYLVLTLLVSSFSLAWLWVLTLKTLDGEDGIVCRGGCRSQCGGSDGLVHCYIVPYPESYSGMSGGGALEHLMVALRAVWKRTSPVQCEERY